MSNSAGFSGNMARNVSQLCRDQFAYVLLPQLSLIVVRFSCGLSANPRREQQFLGNRLESLVF